jgi:Uma2 family endonuclease
MAARAFAKSSLLSSESFPDQGDWTYEDYRRLPDDGWRYEVLRGALHMAPAPSLPHQRAVWNFGPILRSFVRERDLGTVLGAPADILLPGALANPVQPDVFFISKERLGIIHENQIEGAPDLVLEVLSPSNWLTDRREKFEIYAEAGVREYWIADPKNRTVEVFVLRDDRTYELLGNFGQGERARSEILPGFEPAIDDIFER